MYVYFFDDLITRNSVQDLIDRLEEKREKGSGIRLFISTDGGDIDAIGCLIDYINYNKDYIDVLLTSVVQSAGCFFLTDLVKPPTLHDGLNILMFHHFDYEEYTTRRINGWFDKNKRKEGLVQHNERYIEKFRKIGLTEEELDAYRDG